MKTIFQFNLVIYLGAILLHLTSFFYGALSQILLGFIQVIVAMTLINDIDKYSKCIKKTFNGYWIVIFSWILIYTVLVNNYNLEFWHPIFLFVIPMIIGLYFVVITYLIYKESKNIKL